MWEIATRSGRVFAFESRALPRWLRLHPGEGRALFHAVTVERSTRRFCGGVGLREQSTPASVCLDPVTAAAAGESSRL